ncbi:MAG: hypothetical protein KC635_09485 [Myxococcales bacterium]|nr:hypothetical protein [Myxococcales bacterium]MCB9732676.1 hypothetical protein [Deltaproteobacteria bacterium]
MRALMAAALMVSGMVSTTACGLMGASTPERSPEVLAQPIGQAVMGQCAVDGAPHTIRHTIQVTQPTRLDIRADIAQGEKMSAEFLVKDPSGMFVRQIISDPKHSSYNIGSIPAERGTWTVMVVCRQGASAYTMHVNDDRAIATTLR